MAKKIIIKLEIVEALEVLAFINSLSNQVAAPIDFISEIKEKIYDQFRRQVTTDELFNAEHERNIQVLLNKAP